VPKKTVAASGQQGQEQKSAGHNPPSFMFQVVRTRLLAELECAPDKQPKLLSIVAPIGYGKTVLMSELYAHLYQKGMHCYWISLSERHASVERVLYSLRVARSGPEAGLDPTQALLQGDESIVQRPDELIALLAKLPFQVTIFIDNLNSCVDGSLGAFLDALIFRTPASVRFVWSSTTELAIDIGRAKLEGLVRQIGYSDLSLNAQETRELLGADLDGRIGNSGVVAILRQTEGWPAAIRMAQIILAESDQPLAALEGFSGADEDVAALLNRQVLGRFAPDLCKFLLCLAQLRTFTASLCRHATGDDAAEAHLDFLLQRNVFMIPLDRNRKRYRLHSLFREYLLGEGERLLSKARKREVLQGAADWCEQNEYWHDAIDYALAAGAHAAVSRMLDRTARTYVREQGDIQQYIVWVEQLQDEGRGKGVGIGWETHYWYVWALVFQRRYEYGLQQHGLLAARFRDRSASDEKLPPADLSQRIDHLRVCIDLFTDRIDDAYRGAEAWLAASKNKDPYSIGSIGCIKSLCLAGSFKLAQAWQTMRVAQPVLLEIGGADMVGWINLINGTLLVYEGNYALAYDELATGLSQARSRLGDESVLCGTMAFVGAKCAVELGRDDDARELLKLGLKTARNNVLVDTAACGFDAAVKLWSGIDDDVVSIARLRDIAKGYPSRLSLMLSCCLIQRLLRLGRVNDALAEAERMGLVEEKGKFAEFDDEALLPRYRDLFAATAIDLYIATRRFRQADALITRELRIARDDGRAARVVELELARAAVAVQGNDIGVAAKNLTSAIRRAAQRRIVRPFHERADTVARLVGQRKTSSWSFVMAEERDFFDAICRSLGCGGDVPSEKDVVWRGGDEKVKPTPREAELLSLLDIGLSNQEIADRTQISITTIKWHLKNLYKKFGVSTRTAALARARDMTLLTRQ
jgi:LuxR family maltose regulon positive regulatory protein